MQGKIQQALEEVKKAVKGNSRNIEYVMAGVLTNSNILLMSSHGKAKSLLAKNIGKVLGLKTSRVQGSQGLTESKYLARYNVAELMKGHEDIIWKDFINADIKFFDEINRVHPTALNAIFPLMAENEVEFGGSVKKVEPSCFIGTMNPADEATFAMPPPLTDRFDMCINLESTSFLIKKNILGADAVPISQVISKQEVESMRKEIAQVEVTKRIKFKINSAIRDMQLCTYGDKEFLRNFPTCCEKCKFRNNACAAIAHTTPLSDRAYLSAFKLVKAISYIRGVEMNDEIFREVMHFVLPHRIKPSSRVNSNFSTQYEFVTELLNKIETLEATRSQPLSIAAEVNFGKKSIEELEAFIENDLLIAEIYNEIKDKKGIKTTLIDRLDKMSIEELEDIEFKISTNSMTVENAVGVMKKIEELKSDLLVVSKAFKDQQGLAKCISKFDTISKGIYQKFENDVTQNGKKSGIINGSGFTLDYNVSNLSITVKCDTGSVLKKVKKVM